MAVLDLTIAQLIAANNVTCYTGSTYTTTLRIDNTSLGVTQNTTDDDGYFIEFEAEFTQLELNAFYNTTTNNFKFEIDGNIILPTVGGTGNQYATIITGATQTAHYVKITALTTNCIINSIRITGTPTQFNSVTKRSVYFGENFSTWTNPRDMNVPARIITSRGVGTPYVPATQVTLKNTYNTYTGQINTFKFTGTGLEAAVLSDNNLSYAVSIDGGADTVITLIPTGTSHNTFKVIPIVNGLTYGEHTVRIVCSGHLGTVGATGASANGIFCIYIHGGTRTLGATAISDTVIKLEDVSKVSVGEWIQIDVSPNTEYRQVATIPGNQTITVAALSKAHAANVSIQGMRSAAPAPTTWSDQLYTKKWLGIGDSITQGTRVDESSGSFSNYDARLSYFYRACRALKLDPVNMAYQGRTTAQVAAIVANFTTYLGNNGLGIDGVVMMLGTNDLNTAVPNATSATNIRTILVALKTVPGITTKTPIICLACISAGGAGLGALPAYNSIAVQANVTLLKSEGYNAIYLDPRGPGWNAVTMLPDTLHPNAAGKVILQNTLQNVMGKGVYAQQLIGLGISAELAERLLTPGFNVRDLEGLGWHDILALKAASLSFTAGDLITRILGPEKASAVKRLIG